MFFLFRESKASPRTGVGFAGINVERTRPAAIRSSRTELFRDCRHHCPGFEVSKLRNAGSSQCRTMRFKASIAATLGRRDARKLSWRIRLANIARAAALSSFEVTSLLLWPLSHIEQVCCVASFPESTMQQILDRRSIT